MAVEGKGWHTERVTASYIRDWPALFHFAVRAEAAAALAHVLGTDTYRKILVIGELGPSGGEAFRDHAESLGIELLTFPTILKRLIATTELGPDAATDGEHMIRLLGSAARIGDI